ncbi:YeeE/YedE thiosulfate transporter family protein [Spirochaeta dissipatitropha]
MKIDSRYRPYIFGALSGLLLTVSVAIAGQFFGTSTTFPRAASLFVQMFGVDLSQIEFYAVREGTFTAAVFPNWQLLFVLGIGIGAFISAKLSGTFKQEKLPPMWVERFGSKTSTRVWFSLAGGAIAMIGARMAGGCPSGHGVSGVSQLGVSSLIAVAMFFTGGIITARILYGSPGRASQQKSASEGGKV